MKINKRKSKVLLNNLLYYQKKIKKVKIFSFLKRGGRIMSFNKKLLLVLSLLFLPFILWSSGGWLKYKIIHLQPQISFETVSNIDDPIVVFHSFNEIKANTSFLKGLNYRIDQSFAELFIITKKKMYLIKDGYEDPTILKFKKDLYIKKYSVWGDQRNNLKHLLELELQRKSFKEKVGEFSLYYTLVDNLIDFILRTKDKKLRNLYFNIEEGKLHLKILEKNYGKQAKEYKRKQDEVKNWQQEFRERIIALRKETSERVKEDNEVSNSPATKEGAKQEKQTQISDQDADAFYAERPRPPKLRDANFFSNEADGSPDYVAIGERGISTIEFQSTDNKQKNWVKENFSNFYKNIRNKHITRFTTQYKALLLKPIKYSARVVLSDAKHDPLCQLEKNTEIKPSQLKVVKPVEIKKEEAQNSTPFRRIDVFSKEGVHFTAIDCEDDGITETFLVNDGSKFQWFARGMPNLISIYNNKDPEINSLISDLVSIKLRGDPDIFEEFKTNEKSVEKEIEKQIEEEDKITKIPKF